MDTGMWMGIASLIGAAVGALATAWIKITSASSERQRVRDRDAVTDYQKLLDLAEAARVASEAAREKITEALNAALVENLRLKAMIGNVQRPQRAGGAAGGNDGAAGNDGAGGIDGAAGNGAPGSKPNG